VPRVNGGTRGALSITVPSSDGLLRQLVGGKTLMFDRRRPTTQQMSLRLPTSFLAALLALATMLVLAPGAEAGDLSGGWTGSYGNTMELTHSGASITWVARSGDGEDFVHDFTGLISGNAVSGTFKDRPGYRAHATGKITAHVVDECQLKLDVVAVDGGRTWSENGELFSKVMCSGAIESTAPVPISSVSNGCGGAGWDSLVAVQNYLGNVSVYRNSNVNPLAKAYRVNFREACNLHDAGYSGAIVKAKLQGGKIIDFRGWSRAAVDDKFLDDMRLLCRRAIPATAKVALRNCKRRGGNASFGAESRFNFVRSWGHRFFDADLTQAGTQRTGARANDVI
jgi:hypothetical protein